MRVRAHAVRRHPRQGRVRRRKSGLAIFVAPRSRISPPRNPGYACLAVHTMPRKTASARLTRSNSASSARPITAPNLSTGITVILSIAICEGWRSPLCGEGSTSRRQGTDHHGGKLGEKIALHDKGRARLSIVSRRGDCLNRPGCITAPAIRRRWRRSA
jgi:hypothetical protein